MDVSAITSVVSFNNVAASVLLVFGALAGLALTITGCQLLISAIEGDDDEAGDDDEDGDELEDEDEDEPNG